MAHSDWSPSRILVLEDDPLLRDVLRELLDDEGHEVTVAAGGEEAVDRALTGAFDLLIFDIRMEGIDGLEALSRMIAGGLNFPSLAITGFAGDEDPVRALRLGVGEYLRKPFRPEQLLEAVNRLLAEDRMRKATQLGLEGLRETTFWLLKKLRPEQAWDVATRVAQLAEALDLPQAQVAELELVALGLPEAPARAQGWVEGLAERYDGTGPRGLRGQSIPLEARILALALASVERPGQDPGEAEPGRFDPILLEALQRTGPRASTRNLLRAFLSGADRSALEGMVTSAPETPEAMEACLALAHLATDPTMRLAWVRRATEHSRGVGPVAGARAYYRGGLLLRRHRAPEAEPVLRQAQVRLVGLGLTGAACVAELALDNPREEAVEALLRPEHEAELAPQLDWVLEVLAGQPRFEKQLRRLSVRYPAAARHLGLTPPAAEEGKREEGLLRITSFGGLQVSVGGQAVAESAWRGPFAKHLFAFLAAQERPVQEDVILDQFWPEQADNARRRLSGALSSIRRTLGTKTDPILRARDRYSLNPKLEVWHDLREFQRCHREGDYAGMTALHVGPYLEGCYMDWALALRRELEEQVTAAWLKLASAWVETEPERALEATTQVLRLDPLEQGAWLIQLKALVKAGHPEKAVRSFQKCQDALKRELGVEPSIELLEAYHRARLAVP